MSESQEKISVVVAMDFSDDILERIQTVSPRLQVQQHFPDVPAGIWSTTEVLYTGSTFPQPEEAPMLRWIQLHSAGMEKAMRNRIVQAEDVIVTSTSGIHVTQIANYCMMMMLAFNYQLPKMFRFQQESMWHEHAGQTFHPTDMHRQTVGIAGYGSIGRELARIADTLGMRVLAAKRDVKRPAESPTDYIPEGRGDPEGTIPERIYPGEAIGTMAAECDYLVITMPLTEKTRHIVNERVLELMKDTGILINIARGGLVDEKALITALSQGKIGGAALDVFEEEPLASTSPLWQMDNVIISPHISGMTDNYHEKAADLFITNLKRYIEKRPLYNQLDRDAGY